MKSTSVILASLLASLAIAQPHRQHRHAKRHGEKRAVESVVDWVTETEYKTEVVDVTTTVWVSEGFVPPTTSSSVSTTAVSVPAQFYQGASSAPSVSPTTSSSSSVYVAPAPVSSSVAPTTASQPAPSPYVAPYVAPPVASYVAPYVAPVESSTSTTPIPSTPEPTPQSVYTPPTVTTPYSAPAPTSAAAPVSGPSYSPAGSTDGDCLSEGSPCKGDITHYDSNAGTGACGWNNDGKNTNVFALPFEFMGTKSNGNPYCGKGITVTVGGKSIKGFCVDKCMGCKDRAIDLSDHAFSPIHGHGCWPFSGHMVLERRDHAWYVGFGKRG